MTDALHRERASLVSELAGAESARANQALLGSIRSQIRCVDRQIEAAGGNKAMRLIGLFGGPKWSFTLVARKIGVSPITVGRWCAPKGAQIGHRYGRGGDIPPEYNHRIRAAAERDGLPRDAVDACLSSDTCPCCGQGLHDGMGVSIPVCEVS